MSGDVKSTHHKVLVGQPGFSVRLTKTELPRLHVQGY